MGIQLLVLKSKQSKIGILFDENILIMKSSYHNLQLCLNLKSRKKHNSRDLLSKQN